MKNVTINLYSFNDLNKEAQQKAIYEHSEFMETLPVLCENESGEMVEEYEEYSEGDIIDNILANDYLFYENGNLAHCTTYTGKHLKTGTTEFHLGGSTYQLA